MTDKTTRDSPISFRFGKDREKRFREYQDREKLGQSDALHSLLDVGLDAAGIEDPKNPKTKSRWKDAAKGTLKGAEPIGPKAAPKPNTTSPKTNGAEAAHVAAPLGPAPSPPGSRLKKEAAPKSRWKV